MARVQNPQKNFNFDVKITASPFFNPFTVQECTTPDTKIDQVEHGETNHVIKTAGQVKYSNGKLKGILDADGPIDWVWEWLLSVQNVDNGGGDIPAIYKKTLYVEYYDVDGFTVLQTEIWSGAWPCDLAGKHLKRIGSENLLNEFEISVDKVTKV